MANPKASVFDELGVGFKNQLFVQIGPLMTIEEAEFLGRRPTRNDSTDKTCQ